MLIILCKMTYLWLKEKSFLVMTSNKNNKVLDANIVFLLIIQYLHSQESKYRRLQELDEPVKLGQHVNCHLLMISIMTMIMIMMTLTWSPMSLTMSPA